jgi:hypothetical protein
MDTYFDFLPYGNSFDTRINHPGAVDLREPFEYFLELRINLQQVNPPRGTPFYKVSDHFGNKAFSSPWSGPAWDDFKKRYVKTVIQVWDKGFILTPPTNCFFFDWPAKGPLRHLLCRLKIELTDVPSNVHGDVPSKAHVSIPVVHLLFSGPFIRPYRPYYRQYGSDVADVWVHTFKENFKYSVFKQNMSAHEVGHLLLGPAHVNTYSPKCTGGGDGYYCYGETLAQRMNIMGSGNELALENAKPWLDRIVAHVLPRYEKGWTASLASGKT